MWRALVKWWKYGATKLHVVHADPKVQLETALTEARKQHRPLTEQAANVIADQRRVELRLKRAIARRRQMRAALIWMSAGSVLVMSGCSASGSESKDAQPYTEALVEEMTHPSQPGDLVLSDDDAQCFAARVVEIVGMDAIENSGATPEKFAAADTMPELDIAVDSRAERELIDAFNKCLAENAVLPMWANEFGVKELPKGCTEFFSTSRSAPVMAAAFARGPKVGERETNDLLGHMPGACAEDLMLVGAVAKGSFTAKQADCVANQLDDEVSRRILLADRAGVEVDATDQGALSVALLACSDLKEKLADAGFPPDVVTCLTDVTTYNEDEIAAADADEIGKETITEARTRGCLRAMRPATSDGHLTAADNPDAFRTAVTDELATPIHGPEALSSSQTACLAPALVDGLGIDALAAARVSAADVASFGDGFVAPADLGLTVSPDQADRIAEAVIACVDAPSLQGRLWVYAGNLQEWTGEPVDEQDKSKLRECISDKIDPATTLAQVRSYLERGPAAFREAEGRALLEASLAAFETCTGEPPRLTH